MDIKKGKNSQVFGELTIKASPPIYSHLGTRTNKQMLVRVYLDMGRVSDIAKSAVYGEVYPSLGGNKEIGKFQYPNDWNGIMYLY